MGLNIAVAGHGRNGFWNHNVPPGWEYPMVLGVVATGIGISGPGRHGLDASLRLPLDGLTARLGGIALGLALGLAFLLLRNRVPVETAVEEPAT